MATASTAKKDKYIEAIGRRKTARARVRLFEASKNSFVVNDKSLDEYFPTIELQNQAKESLADAVGKYKVSAKMSGGGIHAQAEALCLGIARALIKDDPELRKPLKQKKLLTRDSRMKERKKFGLKKARKSAQWSKR